MTGESASPLQHRAERIQETAKWLTVSLAALGAVLTAGTQVSSIGSLHPWSGRFVPALIGGVLTAIGAGAILGASVWTATTPAVRFSALKSTAELEDPFLLQGRTSLRKLKHELTEQLREREIGNRQTTDMSLTAEQREAATEKAANARIRVDNAAAVARDILDVASYRTLCRRWRRAGWIIAAGATLASVGVVMFIWAVNPPPDEKASVASPAILSPATGGKLSLTSEGREALGAVLGAACSFGGDLPVLVLGQTPSGPDVVIHQEGCNPVRLVVGDSWGHVTTE